MSRAFDPMQLGSIELFCKAAELSSFTAAATAAGITPAAVSRSIGRLEARLGIQLFVRNTRQIKLTDSGRVFFEQCQQALAQIVEASRAATGQQGSPSGVLRISAPTTFAHYRLFPLLPKFTAAYPDLNIEVSVSNRNIDFIEEGFDLAIRLGVPEDSRLVARKLEEPTLGVFAAPFYLKARGVPETLADLKKHDCIPFIMPSSGKPMPWIFLEDGKPVDRIVSGNLKVFDDVLGCYRHARAGGGLVQTFHFITEEAVQSGKLVEILKNYAGRSRQFSILYLQNRHLSSKVRAFADFMTDEIGSIVSRQKAR